MGTHKTLKHGELFSVTTASGLGFNRSGFRFSKEATLLDASQITDAILSEPMLRVEIVKAAAKKEGDSTGDSKKDDKKKKE